MPPGKKHLVFLVNPRSGVQRQKDILSAIELHLDHTVFSFEIQETQYAHHGVQLAKTAAHAGAFGVIAVGGDGSVNDAAAGLSGTATALGILPMGSGNGMARTLGISRKLPEALAVLNSQNITAIDMGYANERPFVSNAGLGFDALISEAFASSKKRGFASYAWLSSRHFFQYQPTRYTITVDGKTWQEEAFIINVANGRQLGYNFQIAPQASYTDGLLDVVILRAFPKWKVLGITLRGFSGRLLHNRYVHHLQCRSVSIQPDDASLLQTDGDAWPCTGKVDFRVQPGALKVFIPK